MTPVKSTLNNARVLHLAFLFTVPLFIYELHLLRPAENGVSKLIILVFSVLCFLDIGIATRRRGRMVTQSEERLRAHPEDVAALELWRRGVIISFAHAETVVLFGFLLKVLGTGWSVAGVFFVMGILLFLAWTPKLDAPTAD